MDRQTSLNIQFLSPDNIGITNNKLFIKSKDKKAILVIHSESCRQCEKFMPLYVYLAAKINKLIADRNQTPITFYEVQSKFIINQIRNHNSRNDENAKISFTPALLSFQDGAFKQMFPAQTYLYQKDVVDFIVRDNFPIKCKGVVDESKEGYLGDEDMEYFCGIDSDIQLDNILYGDDDAPKVNYENDDPGVRLLYDDESSSSQQQPNGYNQQQSNGYNQQYDVRNKHTIVNSNTHMNHRVVMDDTSQPQYRYEKNTRNYDANNYNRNMLNQASRQGPHRKYNSINPTYIDKHSNINNTNNTYQGGNYNDGYGSQIGGHVNAYTDFNKKYHEQSDSQFMGPNVRDYNQTFNQKYNNGYHQSENNDSQNFPNRHMRHMTHGNYNINTNTGPTSFYS